MPPPRLSAFLCSGRGPAASRNRPRSLSRTGRRSSGRGERADVVDRALGATQSPRTGSPHPRRGAREQGRAAARAPRQAAPRRLPERPARDRGALRATRRSIPTDLFDLAGVCAAAQGVAEQYERTSARIRRSAPTRRSSRSIGVKESAAASSASRPRPSESRRGREAEDLARASRGLDPRARQEHRTWEKRDKIGREHYVTTPTPGTGLMRTAEAMDR
jgi:hypothetical protein